MQALHEEIYFTYLNEHTITTNPHPTHARL